MIHKLVPLATLSLLACVASSCVSTETAPPTAATDSAQGSGRPKDRFRFFNAKELEPKGWLRKELEIQLAALPANLDLFWPSVRNSQWIGRGNDNWERFPYWLDGSLTLAYLLRNQSLIDRVQRHMDYILDHQCDDGWICPCTEEQRPKYDLWALQLFTKVLCFYAETTGDPRGEEALYRMLKQFNSHLDTHKLEYWGYARWFETMIAIDWMLERRPEPWLLELAAKLKAQGLDYVALCDNWPYKEAIGDYKYESHVVDMGMALRAGLIVNKVLPDPRQQEQPKRILEILRRYHGMVHGHFTGSEHLAGLSPIQGTELCGVAEAMYSEELQLAATGDVEWGDWLERLAFNAFPATCSPDLWSHQYLQQSNQTSCVEQPKKLWTTNWKEHVRNASCFGLEPYYGCCTVNMGQAWPKLAMATFMKAEDGIFSAVLAPSKVTTTIDGSTVQCELNTGYPFRDRLDYTVECSQPVTFTLYIRIPKFAKSAKIDGKSVPTGQIAAIRRTWEGRHAVTVELDFEAELLDRPYGGLKALVRGPLVFSLPIASQWTEVKPQNFPFCDYDIRPTEAWNFAFASTRFTVEYGDDSAFDAPFNDANPPVYIRTDMVPIPWSYKEGFELICNEFPDSLEPQGPAVSKRLIPYGCTTLRMTEMPQIDNAQ